MDKNLNFDCPRHEAIPALPRQTVKKADKILMEDYTDIDISIRDLITEMNNNHNINAGKLFYMIEIKDFNRFLKVHN